jgi:hypothetical protein
VGDISGLAEQLENCAKSVVFKDMPEVCNDMKTATRLCRACRAHLGADERGDRLVIGSGYLPEAKIDIAMLIHCPASCRAFFL